MPALSRLGTGVASEAEAEQAMSAWTPAVLVGLALLLVIVGLFGLDQ